MREAGVEEGLLIQNNICMLFGRSQDAQVMPGIHADEAS